MIKTVVLFFSQASIDFAQRTLHLSVSHIDKRLDEMRKARLSIQTEGFIDDFLASLEFPTIVLDHTYVIQMQMVIRIF